MPAAADHTTVAWPEWTFRYVGSGSMEAFNDLIWSVGGSPPWGGVSWEEAEAVYELLEAYRGPGQAPESAYDKLLALLKDSRRVSAVEVFRLHDRIASAPEDFTHDDVLPGIALAQDVGDQKLLAYFRLLLAQLLHNRGDIPEALDITRAALVTFATASLEDPVYAANAMKAGQNCVSYAASDGNFEMARLMIEQIRSFGLPEAMQHLDDMLGPSPEFPDDSGELEEHAAELLAQGEIVSALEWYSEAERRARERNDSEALGGLLGDKAVALRRLGNTRRAVEMYAEAIELCRLQQRAGLLSAWTGNLGQIFLEAGQLEEAEEYLEESLTAAERSHEPEKLAIAARNLGALLSYQGRYSDALHYLERAGNVSGTNSTVSVILRDTRASIFLQWGEHLFRSNQFTESLRRYQQAVQLLDLTTPSDVRSAQRAWVAMAAIHEQQNDLRSALQALEQAISCARALRDADALTELEQVRSALTRKSLLI
jgi:tetratricopeptide (TPR) repeat protein